MVGIGWLSAKIVRVIVCRNARERVHSHCMNCCSMTVFVTSVSYKASALYYARNNNFIFCACLRAPVTRVLNRNSVGTDTGQMGVVCSMSRNYWEAATNLNLVGMSLYVQC